MKNYRIYGHVFNKDQTQACYLVYRDENGEKRISISSVYVDENGPFQIDLSEDVAKRVMEGAFSPPMTELESLTPVEI